MKKNVKSSLSDNRKTLLFIAIVFALTALAAFILSFRAEPGMAETRGGKPNTVTIHVYDKDEEYDKLGTWVWVRGLSGKGTETSYIADDEKFVKDLGDKVNKSYCFDREFSASDIQKFKSGTLLGLLVCTNDASATGQTVWGTYKKETADVFVDVKDAFDASNHADVYYVRGDSVAYTDAEAAMLALEKVTSARFTARSKDNKSVDVAFEATSFVTADTVVELHARGEKLAEAKVIMPDDPNAEEGTKLEKAYYGSAHFTLSGEETFDFATYYEMYIAGVPNGSAVSMNAFIDDTEFIKTYETEETQEFEYGSFYTPEKTTFRLWAPFASSVDVKLYRNGNVGDAYMRVGMQKYISEKTGKWGGVWEGEYRSDIKGVYYTFVVNNGGAETETADPYARAAGANGLRSMVVDLDSTDPEGWDEDKHLYATNAVHADTPIIWEVHVNDFSASPDSGMKYKGKYLAFTEENTCVPGRDDLPTGVAYLKELGVTYVHLNPVFDFEGIDESDLSIADDTHDAFNWGYNPLNYNVPEGTYSTDPTRGDVRITEFKQMVMALHKVGIGVVMDVVYNHTSSTSGQSLNDTAPNYYHHTGEDGDFTNDSGCGNGTASERTMMRKFMIESILYWAKEYHIDGFRFDLMGIHDSRTLNMIRDALDSLYAEDEDASYREVGKHILMYGEPWSGDGTYTPPSYTKRVEATKTVIEGTGPYTYNGDNGCDAATENSLFKWNSKDWAYDTRGVLKDRIAIFGDSGRNGMRGDNNLRDRGWANGNYGRMGAVQKMMEGYCGTSGNGINTSNGSQGVAYASAHDNYTLWDQMIQKTAGTETALFYDAYIDYYGKQCMLAASAYLLSSGIPFMLAGEEMGRTKYGNHNSYNSPEKVNYIKWTRQEMFAPMLDVYKKLIHFRLDNHDTFSYEGATNSANCYYNFTGSGEGKIVFERINKKAVKGWLDGKTYTASITDGKTTIAF